MDSDTQPRAGKEPNVQDERMAQYLIARSFALLHYLSPPGLPLEVSLHFFMLAGEEHWRNVFLSTAQHKGDALLAAAEAMKVGWEQRKHDVKNMEDFLTPKTLEITLPDWAELSHELQMELLKDLADAEAIIQSLGGRPDVSPWQDLDITLLRNIRAAAQQVEQLGFSLLLRQEKRKSSRGRKHAYDKSARSRIARAANEHELPKEQIAQEYGISVRTLYEYVNEFRR